MPLARPHLQVLATIFVAALALAAPGAASAATWDGGGDGVSWEDDLNWSPDGQPSDGAVIPQEDPLSPGSELVVTLSTNQFSSEVTIRGTLMVEGTLDAAGQVVVDGGRLHLGGGAGTAQVYGDTLTVSGTGPLDGGYLSGSGEVNLRTVIGDHGFLVPDPSSGGPSLATGQLDVTAGGTLLLRLASATSYGRYQPNGGGTNDGQVVVVPEGGYVPAAGDDFAIGLLDPFARVDSRQVGNGRYLAQSVDAFELVLTTVQSSITASEGSSPGGTVTVTGAGFVEGEAITIDVSSADSATRATTTATSSGTFSVAVPVSTAFRPGAFTVEARGSESMTTTSATGTLVAPTPPPTVLPQPPAPTNDPSRGTDGPDRFVGTAGDDQFFGGAGDDYFSGGAADDRFIAGTGDDRGFGGDGNDFLVGGLGADLLNGNRGSDRVFGGGGRDRVFGGTGGDVVSGGPGADIVRGGPGNDRVFCGSGTDVAFGEDGRDFVSCRDGRGGDVLNGGAGFDTCIGDRGDVYVNCERRLVAFTD